MTSITPCLGIVGGLGPQTSLNFALAVSQKVRAKTGCQPHLLIDHIMVPEQLHKKTISGQPTKEIKSIIEASIKRLSVNCTAICIPCNTVHVFFESLQQKSSVPILNMIEAVKRPLSSFSSIALLASQTTIKQGLYQKALPHATVLTLPPRKQTQLDDIILDIVINGANETHKQAFAELVQLLEDRGADVILLGCSDLSKNMIKSKISVMDSCEIFEDFVVEEVIGHAA